MAQKEEVFNPSIHVKETNPMKRFFTRALAASLLFGAVPLALPSRPLAAADDFRLARQRQLWI